MSSFLVKKSLNIQAKYFKIPNAGMIFFNKRSILNVGMLLTESPIAEERCEKDLFLF